MMHVVSSFTTFLPGGNNILDTLTYDDHEEYASVATVLHVSDMCLFLARRFSRGFIYVYHCGTKVT